MFQLNIYYQITIQIHLTQQQRIDFSIPEQTNVKVIIYDALGNQIDVIADEVKSAGSYSVKWNASNHASGIYFYKLEAGNFVQVRKMILMK